MTGHGRAEAILSGAATSPDASPNIRIRSEPVAGPIFFGPDERPNGSPTSGTLQRPACVATPPDARNRDQHPAHGAGMADAVTEETASPIDCTRHERGRRRGCECREPCRKTPPSIRARCRRRGCARRARHRAVQRPDHAHDAAVMTATLAIGTGMKPAGGGILAWRSTMANARVRCRARLGGGRCGWCPIR